MDLDLEPYSVGGDSTISRIANFGRDLHTTTTTHNRIMVMEVFGRYAGHTAFRGGIGAQADIILIPEIQVDFDIVYERAISLLKERILRSDNKAGMALIMVAEGIRDSSGSEIVDENSPTDSFGHKALIGAGKYVVNQLEKRIKTDTSLVDFMKKTGQFVNKLYEALEVRDVRPGHLVRCGSTSVIDINFGLEVGAGAIELIHANKFGFTVSSFREGKLEYMLCKDAIRQRHVN